MRECEANVYYSEVSSNYEITEDVWVVSLINSETNSSKSLISGGHAKILLEGLKNGNLYRRLFDVLSTTGTYITDVRIKDFYSFEMVNKWHVDSWYVECDKALEMEESIKKDHERIEREDYLENPITYHFNRFLFWHSQEGHNCMSWCKEKLEIADIHVIGKDKPKKIGCCTLNHCALL